MHASPPASLMYAYFLQPDMRALWLNDMQCSSRGGLYGSVSTLVPTSCWVWLLRWVQRLQLSRMHGIGKLCCQRTRHSALGSTYVGYQSMCCAYSANCASLTCEGTYLHGVCFRAIHAIACMVCYLRIPSVAPTMSIACTCPGACPQGFAEFATCSNQNTQG